MTQTVTISIGDNPPVTITTEIDEDKSNWYLYLYTEVLQPQGVHIEPEDWWCVMPIHDAELLESDGLEYMYLRHKCDYWVADQLA